MNRLLTSQSVCLSVQTIRCSSKLPKANLKDLIRLYDQFDRPIGIKTKNEAEEYAKKMKFDLVPRDVRSNPKYEEFALKSRINELDERESSANKDKEVKASQELKRFTFTANITDHDLEHRFLHLLKLMHKNIPIKLLIAGKPNGKDQLDLIYEKLTNKFGKAAQFKNKVFSGHNLKVTIFPNSKELNVLFAQQLTQATIAEEENANDEIELNNKEIDELVEKMLNKK